MKSRNSKNLIEKKKIILIGYRNLCSRSSAGRTLPCEGRGHWFEPNRLHHYRIRSTCKGVFYYSRYDHYHSKCDSRISPVIGSSPIGYTILEKSELQFATFGLSELFLGSTFTSQVEVPGRTNRRMICTTGCDFLNVTSTFSTSKSTRYCF